jgi:hypothetical protein
VFEVFLLGLAVDSYVVDVDYHEFSKDWFEHVVHESLKCRWCGVLHPILPFPSTNDVMMMLRI